MITVNSSTSLSSFESSIIEIKKVRLVLLNLEDKKVGGESRTYKVINSHLKSSSSIVEPPSM